MPKSKKKDNPEILKERTTVYVSKELMTFARENNLNVSKLLNNTLNRLRLGLGEFFETDSENFALISRKTLKNSLNVCLHPDLNRGQPDLQSGALPTEL